MQPVTSLRVKSVILAPRQEQAVTQSSRIGEALTITGAAWSGDAGPVTRVEVSVDAGRSWRQASMPREQRTEFGWRLWSYRWTPRRDGEYTLMVRARDAAGNTQPLAQEWNPSGYLWNVVPRVRVRVGLGVEGGIGDDVQQPLPPAALKSSCLACHNEDVIQQQRLTRAQWDAEISKMVAWGAKVSNEDRSALLDYFAARYGPRSR
jgi:hypothetical protein